MTTLAADPAYTTPTVTPPPLGLGDLFGEPEFCGDAVKHPEGLLLFALCQATRPRLLVETGTNKGFSACLLALGAGPGGVVHTFDIEDLGARRLWERYGVADRIVFHHQTSLRVPPVDEIAAEGVHLAFFDADHREAFARLEWEAWRDRVAPGGLCLWHDSWFPEVVDVVRHLARTDLGLTLLNLPTEQGLAVAQFKADATWRGTA